MAGSDFIEVRIHGQLFRLCAGTEKEYVQELASYVDLAMQTAVKQSKSVSSERIAVMAALNIADTLFQQKRQSEMEAGAVRERINRLVASSEQLFEK